MSQDPYAPYLRQADELFAAGDIVKAGQIWQAILKREPGHAQARARLLEVKQRLEAQASPAPEPPAGPPIAVAAPAPPAPPPAPEPEREPAPPRPPVPAPPAGLEPERLVIEGCTLYDMGQLEDALKKWELVLSLDPTHRLAREYANGARRDLGLPPLEAPVAPAGPAPEGAAEGEEDLDKLLHEAVQLYDIGLVEDAVSKWERALALAPGRMDVRAYLNQAKAELERRAPAPSPAQAPTPAQAARPAGPDPGLLDLKLRQADHLLGLQRHEEAAFTYQQALALDPGNARAREGLERCRPGRAPAVPAPVAAPALQLDAQGRIPMAVAEPSEATLIVDPQPVTPPASLVKAAAPRAGLSLPKLAEGPLAQFPWLRDPKVLALIGGGFLLLLLGLGVLHRYRKDQALKEAVQAARAAALAPISREAQAVDLAESAADMRREAGTALDMGDPLRAYLRATTLVQRNPGDAAAADLLEKAKAALPGGAVGATLAEYQKHLQGGDLDAAAKVMDALLRATPDDPDLRRRAARLQLALCEAHAGQGKWDDATLDLQRGRALFPDDKAWQARLALLQQVRALPKGQRGDWVALLG